MLDVTELEDAEVEESCGCNVPLNKDGSCPSCRASEFEYKYGDR